MITGTITLNNGLQHYGFRMVKVEKDCSEKESKKK